MLLCFAYFLCCGNRWPKGKILKNCQPVVSEHILYATANAHIFQYVSIYIHMGVITFEDIFQRVENR